MTEKFRRKREKGLRQESPFRLYKDPENPCFEEGLDAVVNLLRGKKNIIVLLGAGISVSCGIPDFRTKGSGIYSTLNAEELGLSCPEELFEASFFNEDPKPFYKFARNLYFPLGKNERIRPSDSHKLLALLDQKKMLRRCYSQNIDGLEELAGVSPKKIVCAHGSLQWAACCKCKRKVNSKELEHDIINGNVARCQAPIRCGTIVNKEISETNSAALGRRTSSRKRTRVESLPSNLSPSNLSGDDSRKPICGGVMKPCITFFGEALSTNVKRCLEADRDKADALIVIGTSLSVAPMSRVVGYLPPKIPRILINRTIAHPKHSYGDENDVTLQDEEEKDFRNSYIFDAYLLGFCDDVTRALGKLLFTVAAKATSSIHSHDAKIKGKLLATLDDNDKEFSAKDWKSSTNVPFERVFLFPGAQPSARVDKSNDLNIVEGQPYQEIVYCDGCSERIVGTIKKCSSCFDYDLCRNCYPMLSKTHYDGKHHFVAETEGLDNGEP